MSSSGKVFSLGKSLKLFRARGVNSPPKYFCQFFNHSLETGRPVAVSFLHQQQRHNSSGPLPGDNSREPFIPAYQQREGESVETLKARLLYQSRKRGMLENGLLLSTFAAKFLNSMSELELREYDRLINLPSNDWDIYYWATGVKPIPKEFDTAILHKFIDHVRNADRESRIRQPDL